MKVRFIHSLNVNDHLCGYVQLKNPIGIRASDFLNFRMRRSSSSPHAEFFKSLRRLEKRLEIEDHHSQPPSSPPAEPQEIVKETQPTDSLGTPIYIAFNNSIANTNSSDHQESEIPNEFLSSSPDFSPDLHNLPEEKDQLEPQRTIAQADGFGLDDEIEQLMQLLRLPDPEETNERTFADDLGCDDGFYGKIVGVKGPKSAKEADRLEQWIKHHLNDEKTEPLILAHLLLGKASFVHSDNDSDGFGGFTFPSTIDEFLQNDPPTS